MKRQVDSQGMQGLDTDTQGQSHTYTRENTAGQTGRKQHPLTLGLDESFTSMTLLHEGQSHGADHMVLHFLWLTDSIESLEIVT